jgi:hypothetical protein
MNFKDHLIAKPGREGQVSGRLRLWGERGKREEALPAGRPMEMHLWGQSRNQEKMAHVHREKGDKHVGDVI